MVKTVSVAAGGVTVAQLQEAVTGAIDMVKKSRASTLPDYSDFLLHLQSYLKDAEDLLNALSLEAASAAKFTECRVWMQCALTHVSELQRDVELLDSDFASYMERKAMIADQCDSLFKAMDFSFLFDAQRKVRRHPHFDLDEIRSIRHPDSGHSLALHTNAARCTVSLRCYVYS